MLLQFCFQGWRDQWRLKWPSMSSPRVTEGKPAGQIEGDRQATHPENPIKISEALGYTAWRLRLLWMLVPLFLVWGNSHGGFVAGLCVVIAYLGMRSIESLSQGGGLDQLKAGWGLHAEWS